MTEFSVSWEILAGKWYFEEQQNYMGNKNEGNENKIISGVLWIKWTEMVEM